MTSGKLIGYVAKLSISKRIAQVCASPTLAITAKAKILAQSGCDVVSFAAGEPDFNTPDPICDAAIAAIRSGQTKYTASSGLPELKKAICEKFERDNNLSYQPSQIVASCGAKHSIYNALATITDPGDEIIIFAPYWMTYADQILLAGGKPVFIDTTIENGYVPAVDQLINAITPRTKAILMNSPCNPTGAVWPNSLIESIAKICVENQLFVISDEIYEHLIYEGSHLSIASLGKEIYDQTITVNGCSKSYSMTGWRVGFAASAQPIAQAMSNLQDQVTSNPTTFAQIGAIAALQMPLDSVHAMREEFRLRRELIVDQLSGIDGINFCVPHGAFYLFIDARSRLGNMPDTEFAIELLEKHFVALIPGSVFRAPGHLRLSYATSREQIIKGTERLRSIWS